MNRGIRPAFPAFSEGGDCNDMDVTKATLALFPNVVLTLPDGNSGSAWDLFNPNRTKGFNAMIFFHDYSYDLHHYLALKAPINAMLGQQPFYGDEVGFVEGQNRAANLPN